MKLLFLNTLLMLGRWEKIGLSVVVGRLYTGYFPMINYRNITLYRIIRHVKISPLL